MNLSTIIFLWGLILGSDALNFEGVEEHYHCDKFPVQENVDGNWLGSVDKWYIPLWNRVEFYHNALQFYGPQEFSKLSHPDLDHTCLTYTDNGTGIVTFSAFGDRQLQYHAHPDPLREGIYYWSAPSVRKVDPRLIGTNRITSGQHEYVATSYTTLSDNKNYLVTICLWEDGRKGFMVSSPKPKLDDLSLRKVKRHLRHIGFNPRHFVTFNYDNCKQN